MKGITLRNVPPEIARAIEERARTGKTSLNKAAISLFAEATGTNKNRGPRTIHTDLDALACSWTRKDAAAFDRELKKQRRIDPAIWK